MNKVMTVILGALMVIVIAVIVCVIIAFPVMWLWNWLMPPIFGLIKISFWQALGLAILSSLLFKSNTSSK